MKYFFTLLSALVISISGQAQINAYYVLASSGSFTSVEGVGSASTTIGEMSMVQTFSAGRYALTQGFQQGNMLRGAAVSLPVTFLSFDGYNKGNINHLEWQTVSEIDNAGFEVERLNQDNQFEKIGYVAGHGNSNTLLDYSYDDAQPLNGENYYRLKQTDADGKYSYSDVISIYAGQGKGLEVSIYPQPVTDMLNIVMHNDESNSGTMIISNVMGSMVYAGIISINEGSTLQKVDMRSYAPGQYFIRLTTGSTTQTVHIVKQ